MDRWTLRNKLLSFLKTWPILLLIIILSSLVGWGAMHLWRPQPRASADLYLGIDITRVIDISSIAVYAKTEPMNVDDYKNWQLSQFAALAASEEIAGSTLKKLRENYQSWDGVTVSEFQDMGSLSWYDTGRWRLTIKAPTRKEARQGATAWRETLQSKMSALHDQAEKAYQTEGRLRALDAQIVTLELRNLEIQDLQEEVQNLKDSLAEQTDSPVSDELHNSLLFTVREYAGSDSGWTQVLTTFPERNTDPEGYQEWLNQVQLAAETELDNNLEQLDYLDTSYQEVNQTHIQNVQAAKGFSPALIIEDLDKKVRFSTPYPDGIILLLSGLMGALIYVIFWIMRDESKEEFDD